MDLLALEREARRLYGRYAIEVVEELGLCPWARRARLEGRVVVRVLFLESLDETAQAADEIEALARTPSCEIGLLLFPRLEVARQPFERWVARLRELHDARHELGAAPWAFAAFHPDAEPDLGSGERLVPFLRRTPDPTLQLVRLASLEAVREGTPQGTCFVDPGALNPERLAKLAGPTLRSRIADANLQHIQARGVETVRALLDDLRRDRDRTYAALARGAPAKESGP